MSAAKVVGIAIGVLLLLVGGAFVYVSTNANSIVRNAVEALGSQHLGALVQVGAANVSLRDGRVTLSDVEIGNPPGYAGPFALRLRDVSATLDVAASNMGLIVFERIVVAGVEVAAVAKSARETNLSVLAAALPSSVRSSTRVNVESLDVSDVRATLASPLSPAPVDVAVSDLHLSHIGSGSDGPTSGEVIRQVFEPIARAVALAAVEQGVRTAGGPATVNATRSLEQLRGALQSLGHP